MYRPLILGLEPQVVVRDIPGECGNGELEVEEECDDGCLPACPSLE